MTKPTEGAPGVSSSPPGAPPTLAQARHALAGIANHGALDDIDREEDPLWDRMELVQEFLESLVEDA